MNGLFLEFSRFDMILKDFLLGVAELRERAGGGGLKEITLYTVDSILHYSAVY
jgi:hypothetical protein